MKTEESSLPIITQFVSFVIYNGTPSQAMLLMEHLRSEAKRIDRHLADPRHTWNNVQQKDTNE